jgi:hypothetical protein
MENILFERKERILIFFREYYFGVSKIISILRIIGGPFIFYFGYELYANATGRFGIGYGGFMVVFSIYYSLKPLWWILMKWEYYKTIEFQLEATEDKLFLKEEKSESQTEYSKFENIVKRKQYFMFRVQKGLKIYIPINQLSAKTVEILSSLQK